MSMIIIVPVNDIEEHEDELTTCHCLPDVIFENGEMIIIHNAFDNRE
jgi:hypothetical protein